MTVIEFIEKDLGLELFDWQKEILLQAEKTGEKYVTFPPGKGHIAALNLATIMDNMLKGEK